MIRLLLILLLASGTAAALRAQEPDSLRRDTIPKPIDSVSVQAKDTLGGKDTTETRRERRQREKREREAKEQEQTVVKDSARLALEALSRRPWKQSLMVPGWGQITNGGWWWLKVPVIYGGFVSAVLVFEFNNRYYHEYLAEAQYRVMNNNAVPPDSKYSYWGASEQNTNTFIQVKDYYRRTRDLTVLVTVGWWGLQAVEAYVTSMLKHRWELDDGDDLSFSITPTVLAQPNPSLAYQSNPYVIGLKVNVRF